MCAYIAVLRKNAIEKIEQWRVMINEFTERLTSKGGFRMPKQHLRLCVGSIDATAVVDLEQREWRDIR